MKRHKRVEVLKGDIIIFVASRNQFSPLTNRDLCSQLHALVIHPSPSHSSVNYSISYTPCPLPPKTLLLLQTPQMGTASNLKNHQTRLSKQPRRMKAQSSSNSNKRKSSNPSRRRIRLKMSLNMSRKWVFLIVILFSIWMGLLTWISRDSLMCKRSRCRPV